MVAIQYQPFLEFHEEVKRLVAPEGLAEELEVFFRDQVGNALCDMQTLLPPLRDMQVNFFEKADVNEYCAASILSGPLGKITECFAYKPGAECRKFHYKRVTTAAIDCWMDRQRCVLCTFVGGTAIYDSPYCNYVISGEAACAAPYLTITEDDCRFRMLDDSERIFAVGADSKVFLAPRFPCGYIAVLQWQGIRRHWGDTDSVPVDQQIREAVVNYVEYKVALKEKDRVAATDYFNNYTINLRTLKFRFFEEQEPGQGRDCSTALEQMMAHSAPLYELPVYSLT